MNLEALPVWYLDAKDAVITAGFASEIDWAASIKPPECSFDLAREAIFVICNSGMRATVARGIFVRVMESLQATGVVGNAFKHPGKVKAIEFLWKHQQALLEQFSAAADKVAWCGRLPWVGPITMYHLAKNLGVDVVKPDRHLERVARAWGTDPHALCVAIQKQTGERLACIDTVIWRACERGIIDSNTFRPAAAGVPPEGRLH